MYNLVLQNCRSNVTELLPQCYRIAINLKWDTAYIPIFATHKQRGVRVVEGARLESV